MTVRIRRAHKAARQERQMPPADVVWESAPSDAAVSAGTPMLQVRDLRAGYGDKEIVHGVSFDIPRGQFVCVIGANGCGKSTLLRNLLGLVEPFGGTVRIEGKPIGEMDEREPTLKSVVDVAPARMALG